jgi:hypothetical protein
MRVLARNRGAFVRYDLARDKVGHARWFQHRHRTVAQRPLFQLLLILLLLLMLHNF